MAGNGKGAFRIAIEDFLETFEFENILFKWQSGILEKFEEAAIAVYIDTVKMLYPTGNLPPGLSADNFSKVVRSSQNGFFAWVLGMGGLLFGGFFGLGQPSGRAASYYMDSQLRTFRADISTITVLRERGLLKDDLAELALNDLGLPDELKDPLARLSEYIPTPIELEVLRRREMLPDSTYLAEMKLQSVTAARIAEIQALAEIIPGPQDLITMAVREAFSDDFISKFGLGEDFPPDFGVWAKRQGLSEEWSRRYWAAHWQLPSPQQVFEMLHRLRPGLSNDPVTSDTVSEYLKAADYSPFWREKLKAISYAPFTRVDIRRMYKVGVLNESQVKDAYLDIGYDEEHAQALTEFTIAFEAEEESGVVRGSVTSAYKSGFIDRSTAESMLSTGGYDSTTVAFYLDSIDFTNDLEIQQIKLTNIKKRYVEGVTDETTVNQEINMLNLPGEKVLALLELWTTERDNQTSLPTTAQVEKFYEMGIITRNDFVEQFKRRAYTPVVIEWTLKRIDIEASEKAKKDTEAAQKEADALAKSKTASIYQKNRADLDLEIAKARSELTDIAVALHAELDEFEAQALFDRQDELKQYISAVTVRKAELRQELAGTLIIQE